MSKIKELEQILRFNAETLKHIPEAKDEYQWCRDMLYAIENNNLGALISFDDWKKQGEIMALIGTDLPVDPFDANKGTIWEHKGYKYTPFQKLVKNIVRRVINERSKI